MPLIKEFYPANSSVIGIWQITESLDELLKINLSDKSQSHLKSLKVEKRKKEWLVTRHVIQHLLGTEKFQIVYDQFGKPELEDQNFCLSISHCKNFVAVYLDAENEIGIDIEEVRNQIIQIIPKFLSESEISNLSLKNRASHATICWSAKESLYKYFAKRKVDFKEHLLLDDFDLLPAGEINAKIVVESYLKSTVVHYLNQGDFILTWTF